MIIDQLSTIRGLSHGCQSSRVKPVCTSNRHFNARRARLLSQRVLGIETSCDDTGAAVVTTDKQVLGEDLHSQTAFHVRMGGILPPVARDFHRENIHRVVENAITASSLQVQDMDAIAVTVKPGLPMSLSVGVNFAVALSKQYYKPLIPVHHMQAHALMPRLLSCLEFPYLVLLISGGHCLLCVVREVNDFIVLGHGLDDAPGDAYDKIARRMKLSNLPQCVGLSGGAAIELVARQGDPMAFPLYPVMRHSHDCNFSFSGIKTKITQLIIDQEKKYDIQGGQVLPNVADICANFQYNVLHHLGKRLQRAIKFCDQKQLLPKEGRTLVLSGGVASNTFLREGLELMCSHYRAHLLCPPAHLCTDNGLMIAWNGAEKLMKGLDILAPGTSLSVEHRCPIGEDWTSHVEGECIKLDRVKFLPNG